MLSVEHRAAGAPEPVTLALVGTESDMHLALVAGEGLGVHAPPSAPADIDTAILDALDHATTAGLPRDSLRAALRVRNERLGDALTRLTASGHIGRNGDAWVHLAVPVHMATAPPPRNGNGNDGASG